MQRTAPAITDELVEGLLGFLGHVSKVSEHRVFDVAVELDLTMSQLRALFVLRMHDRDLALGELAAEVRLSVAATGRLVDALVRADLVSRREDPADRRVKRLALTRHGEEVLDRFADARREGLRQVVETLDDDACDHLSRALAALPTLTPCRPTGPETDTTS